MHAQITPLAKLIRFPVERTFGGTTTRAPEQIDADSELGQAVENFAQTMSKLSEQDQLKVVQDFEAAWTRA